MSKDNPHMKKFMFSINLWLYDKLKMFAQENGMTVTSAIRYIVNQFFKTRP